MRDCKLHIAVHKLELAVAAKVYLHESSAKLSLHTGVHLTNAIKCVWE